MRNARDLKGGAIKLSPSVVGVIGPPFSDPIFIRELTVYIGLTRVANMIMSWFHTVISPYQSLLHVLQTWRKVAVV